MCRESRILITTNMKLIILISIFVPLSASISHEKVDEAMVQTSVKCGECPCVNPCGQQEVPPPPPPPPPPTPKFTQYCPPQTPPPPRFYYVSGPPELSQSTPPPPRFTYVIAGPRENKYPVDPFNLEIYNRGTCDCNVLLGLLLPIIYGLLQILAF